jgi:pyruvate dehydrogenase E2 component (dihydrolipoamide acetyltransferase)
VATFEFKLPDIGEGVVEGEIVKWLVKEGEEIGEDQPMVEVMTDKATVTIPSPRRGRVAKLHGKEGETARVHQNLVTLAVDGPPPAAAGPKKDPLPAANGAGAVAATTRAQAARVLATPVTRRIAREHGVDLSSLAGTGPGGRILKTDVMATLRAEADQAAASPGGRAFSYSPVQPAEGDERVALKGLRKVIARKMVQSKFTAPHYTFVEEMDATELKAVRARLNQKLEEAHDPLRLSYLPFVCKALVPALGKHPTVNANFDEAAQELVVRRSLNLGIAVATDEGLVVPVVKDVERKSLRDLGEEIRALASAARERRLRPEDLSGGSFTITSLGEAGGLFATPIINHPEVAILGVHRMRPRPVVKDERITIRDMMYLSFSFDHRVIDGAEGAGFAYDLIRFLENPELLLLELA